MSGEPWQRILVVVFAVLVLANAFAAGLRTVSDSDTGWHLATGRYVWVHRTIPSTDVLSFASAGQPWIYPPFGQVFLYLTYRVGGYVALSWLSALACVGIVAYLIRKRTVASGRATCKEYLAGFLFLWHYSERLYTYRIDAIPKRRSRWLTIWLFWKLKDPSSWKSS